MRLFLMTPLLCRICLFVCIAVASPVLHAEPASSDDAVVVDSETNGVIKGALKWLAAKQSSNGSWFSGDGGPRSHPVAFTGYTLMAFMAAGNLPEEGEFSRNVSLGAQFLLDSIQPDGTFRGVDGSKYMYNHGIATIALTELYGETKSQTIRPKLERLLKVIFASQGRDGGWRYQPRPADSDISVTVLQVVALRSAKNAGFNVPQEIIEKAVEYVRSCVDANSGGFCYQPQKSPGFARTAAAIYSLQVCGQYDDPLVKAGSEYLMAHSDDPQYWTYGSYYAAPAEYMIGGESWKRWYGQYKSKLLREVERAGDLASWKPTSGAEGMNELYCTAVYTKMLAMPYHYLPLDQR